MTKHTRKKKTHKARCLVKRSQKLNEAAAIAKHATSLLRSIENLGLSKADLGRLKSICLNEALQCTEALENASRMLLSGDLKPMTAAELRRDYRYASFYKGGD